MKSREDHGFTLDLGVEDVSCFLPFNEIEGASDGERKELYTGALVDVTITKASAKGRICTVSADSSKFSTSHVRLCRQMSQSNTNTIANRSSLRFPP